MTPRRSIRQAPFGPLLLAIAGSAGFIASLVPASQAIPAFARRYQMSCTTCHAPFPRLKPFGEEFAGRGFRLEDPSQEPARATYDVGDPMLKLFRDLPLAMRFDGFAAYTENAKAEFDFELPWTLKLLSGGPISDSFSYYVYGIFEEGESVKLEDAYVQYSGLFGLPVDLFAGQFQVSDPLFKRELRLERNDYQIFKTRIGAVPTNLTYDRGLVAAWHAPAAFEVIGQVVNGNGIGPLEDESFDTGTFKNYAGRVVRSFGPLRLGIFGYWGQEKAHAAIPEDGEIETQLWYWGPDVVLDIDPHWQLNLEYLERRDEDPFFTGDSGDDFVTRGGFAELHWLPQGPDGRWVLTGLYNKIDSDVEEARFENASLTLNRLMARNVRLLLEGEYDLEVERVRASLGLVTAF